MVHKDIHARPACTAAGPPHSPRPICPTTVRAATGDQLTRDAWPDDAVGSPRGRGRRAPTTPPCRAHREASFRAHATAGAPAPAGRECAARISEAGTTAACEEAV
ncbi:hypothetical protein SALB_08028 [Streptomyces noursei]|uniref:Uncharacterized protein n=1 Tax=Streptomyces noursei TaxID=1971 RepID=A0A401RC77_STRNR|nr:hypothetical protein SALB_08028 [Streptomyces noursei]